MLLACVTLEFAVLMGAPMRPEEIRELMQAMNQPTLAHVLPSEEEAGGGSGAADPDEGPVPL